MSFYGSIYYQLVDTFYKVLIKNHGYENTSFPKNPANEYGYQAAGRKGTLDFNSGNRWIVFTHDDATNSFKMWHNEAGGDNLIDTYGFHKIDAPPENADVIILSPDDYFMTTGMSEVDAAGHIIPGEVKYYKMPKSDVTERLENIEDVIIPGIQELNTTQNNRLDIQENYIGNWDKYRGYTYDSSFDDYDWFPGISQAIGSMTYLIDGTSASKDNMSYYYNQKASITGAIGNLSKLLQNFATDLNLQPEGSEEEVKVHQINLIDVLLYLKNTLITNLAKSLESLSTVVNTQGLLLNATSDTVQNTIIPRLKDLEEVDVPDLMADIEDILDPDDGILASAKAYIDEVAGKNTEAIENINDGTSGILATAKAYTDSLGKDVKANKNAIDNINNGTTGILATAKDYTDSLGKDVKANKNAIDNINNGTTGILATAKSYTDEVAGKNTEAIENINDGTSGILVTAKAYTDSEIQALSVSDTEEENKYVSAVSEANGKIAVSRTALPTYTLSTGKTAGTVALNGAEATVQGLGTAAFTNASDYEKAGAATEAIANLQGEDGIITLLQSKIKELEERLAKLEPPPEESTPDPEESEQGEV